MDEITRRRIEKGLVVPGKMNEHDTLLGLQEGVRKLIDPLPSAVVADYKASPTPEIRKAILEAVPPERRLEISELLDAVDRELGNRR